MGMYLDKKSQMCAEWNDGWRRRVQVVYEHFQELCLEIAMTLWGDEEEDYQYSLSLI